MPEQLWLLVVGLLVGLLVGGAFLWTTLDPFRPEAKLVRLLNELAGLRDLETTVVFKGGAHDQWVEANFKWLRGEGAFRLQLIAPEPLRGQVFSYQGGQLNHFLPAAEGRPAGVVIVRLPATADEGTAGNPLAAGFWAAAAYLDELRDGPGKLLAALRSGALRVRESRDDTIKLEVWGEVPGGAGPVGNLEKVVLELTPAQGEEPAFLLETLRGVTFYLAGGEAVEVRFSGTKINQGLTLREVRRFGEEESGYEWVLP